ncbi:MAG: hypothetical protein GXP27_00280, partial [Planctomycetes bacterium]|nr:hypothetical protein [Planctomycetota bacterium]
MYQNHEEGFRLSVNPYFRVQKAHQRTIVVGDIHGCFDELQQLLKQVAFSPGSLGDVLVCVGDLVDRGPASWAVAEFFRDTPNAYSVLGNHERRLAGTVRGTSQPAWSQLQTLSRIPSSAWTAWAEYLGGLPAVIETDHAVITHARLDPALPLDRQDPYHTCAVGGAGVVIQRDQNDVPLWFYELNLPKPICIGHVGYARVELVPGRLFALDGRAVRGGELLAVVFPENTIVSVKAAKNYYAEARARWRDEEWAARRRLRQWRA